MDRASLQWVQADIEDSLRQACIALESFADDPSEGESLRVFADTLHGVRGVLEMLEVYGCSLLFDEMEGVIDGLMAGAINRRDDACEVLMQGVIQVPEYLDFIARGNRDNAVVLMPLLNDFRSVRGMPLLSENALFAPDLSVQLPVSERAVALEGAEFVSHMRKLRPYFQRGLVGWYRGDDLVGAFQMLDAVVLHVEKAIGSSPASRLWWIVRALVQALRTGGLDHSVSLKLLLGRVDRQLKQLAQAGTSSCAQEPPEDLLKNLLYYVAQSSTRTRRIDAVRATFKLDELLSGSAENGDSGQLFGPNLDTFSSVSVAVKDSLARIKHALDTYSHKDSKTIEELVPLSAMLREIADTLGLLGLGIARRSILEQRDVVEELTEAGSIPTNDQLLDIAGVMLGVDATMDTLSEQGFDCAAKEVGPDEALDPSDSNLTGIEYLQLVTSVIGEIKTDLAVVKDAIATFLEDPTQGHRLDDVPRRVEQVIGGMRMLYLKQAAELMERWLRFVDRVLLNNQAIPNAGTLEMLADGVESIEYYLESVANARSDAEERLAGAQDRIRALPDVVVGGADRTPVVDTQLLSVGSEIEALKGQLDASDEILHSGDTSTVDFVVDEVAQDTATGGEVDFPLHDGMALDADEITIFDVSGAADQDSDAGGIFGIELSDSDADDESASAPTPVWGLDDDAIAVAALGGSDGARLPVGGASSVDFDVGDISDESGEFGADAEFAPPPLPDSVLETLAYAQSLLARMAQDEAESDTHGRALAAAGDDTVIAHAAESLADAAAENQDADAHSEAST
jgi:chemosensory pili system protein ChpA (sensor histidine kinase/response regulator)